MTEKALAKFYLNNFSDQVKNETDRLFGLEIELTLVNLSDHTIITDASVTEKILLEIALEKKLKVVYDSLSNKPIRIETSGDAYGRKMTISPDFSLSTIEIATLPETSLQTLLKNTLTICKEVSLIAKRNGVGLIAGGMHPFAKPDRSQIYLSNSRYVKTLLPEELPQLICQSLQFTFNLNADELVTMYANFQKVVPLLTRLFSASPIYNGKATNKYSFREWYYLQRSFVDNRYGFGPIFGSINDYYALIINYPLSRIIRDNKMIFLDKEISFCNFLAHKKTYLKHDNDDRSLFDDFELFESTTWHNIRVRSKIGAIEIRSVDSLPIDYIAPFTCFIRGLIANMGEVNEYLAPIKVDHLQQLHKQSILEGLTNDEYALKILPHLLLLSEKGLQMIGEDVCIGYLDKLKKIISDRKNISDLIYEQYIGSNSLEDKIFNIMSILSYE